MKDRLTICGLGRGCEESMVVIVNEAEAVPMESAVDARVDADADADAEDAKWLGKADSVDDDINVDGESGWCGEGIGGRDVVMSTWSEEGEEGE